MKQYQPQAPFNVAARHKPRTTKKVNGVNQETFTDGNIFYCSAKSYGGTEKVVNDILVVEDTWTIDTWYNSEIKKGDHIVFLDDNTEYEILATPENINRRNQYMRFKVVRIGG